MDRFYKGFLLAVYRTILEPRTTHIFRGIFSAALQRFELKQNLIFYRRINDTDQRLENED